MGVSDNIFFIDPVKVRSDVIFRQTHLNLRTALFFSSSPYGGPSAIAYSSHGSSWEVSVQTASGRNLSTIKVANLFALHWTRCHRLVIVGSKGRIYVYNPLGKLKSQFIMDKEISIMESRTFLGPGGATGLAVLTENNRIFVVNSVLEPVPWRISDIIRSGKPSAWNVITSPSSQISVLLVIGDSFYAAMQGVTAQPVTVNWKLPGGEYVDIIPYWDYSRVAFAHSSGIIQVVNSDFTILSVISVNDEIPPSSLTAGNIFWCGMDAVAIKSSRSSLQILSFTSEHYTFNYGSDIRIDAEVDGVKVFSCDELIFLSPVPEDVESVLGIASAEPGAILFEASEKLEKGLYGVYEYIHMIEANLQKAFLQCLMAAAHQFDHQLQKKLLKAAALGKALSRCQDSSQFGDTCRVIRVLNAIRQPYIGIAISFTQSTELKMTSLINRLIDIEHWPLAMEFCKYMHLPVVDGAYRVLALWALSKIEKAREEKEKGRTPDYGSISELIVGQFAAYPEISFADVAMKAVDANLPEMAEILLEKETRPYRQVEMLLKLDKTEKALAKAARSQQPDLMHLVLAHIKRTWRKEKADLLIRKIPQAFCLYQDCLREEAPRHLLALYQQEDDFAKQALFHLAESSNVSWNPFDMSEKLEFLSKAEKCLTDLKEPSLNQLATDALALLKFGESLDAKPGFGDIDRTNLRSIFIWLAGKQEDSLLEQLRKNFKLSEKQYSTWKIEGLAKAKKWNHLENLVKTKKVTVGYLSLITLCVQYENTELASSFIEKLTSPDDVIKAHVLVGNPVRAAEIAAKRKDLVSLERIYNRFRSNDETARLIQKLLRECRTKPE